jgi:hypothetical protein
MLDAQARFEEKIWARTNVKYGIWMVVRIMWDPDASPDVQVQALSLDRSEKFGCGGGSK